MKSGLKTRNLLFFLLFALVFVGLVGCSTTRVYDAPYKVVRSASIKGMKGTYTALDEDVKSPGKKSVLKGVKKEKVVGRRSDFFLRYKIKIHSKGGLKKPRTKVTVRVKTYKYLSGGLQLPKSSGIRNDRIENDFLDGIQKRLDSR